MKSVRSSSAGFSLVELMVVVAIIGILATIAMPQINQFMARARQSEAKGNLSTLYATEKAFFAEYNTYFGGLRTVGYQPEGNLRYRIGFSAIGTPAAAALPTYGYPSSNAPSEISTAALCGTGLPCTELAQATGATLPTSSVNINTFTASASSLNIGMDFVDTWTIDQNKSLNNPSSGVTGTTN